ncbi:hypothetical protein TEA_016486 [Camellia sinensis var. sinensis]|uniref:Uncharacterized protein n=1 Tax=Camellia sinensis var. sinensis TaxID=542762 RepID=A0A4V3WN33_CAMSN|nr:hypothetical protein TEA_016486 [Camellia sinensis var. sinensis]
MADIPGYVRACLQTGKLVFLAILVSGGIVLQVLACALYNNWWPMLTGREMQDFLGFYLESFPVLTNNVAYCHLAAVMYVLFPLPLLFFAGSDTSSFTSESSNGWVDASKFLSGASAMGSIAIPTILRHAGVIGWGALGMQLGSYFVFILAVVCYIKMNGDDDGYSMF